MYAYANKALHKRQIVHVWHSLNRRARRVPLNLGVSQHTQSMLLSSLFCLLSLPNADALSFVARFVTLFDPQSNLHIEVALSAVLIVDPRALRLCAYAGAVDLIFHSPLFAVVLLAFVCRANYRYLSLRGAIAITS